MRKSIVLLVLIASVSIASAGQAKIAAEWQKLREELRKQGVPVAARVETPREIAADMERVRREMERRSGRPPVSDIQRVGGGGGPAVRPQRERGLRTSRLQGVNTNRR